MAVNMKTARERWEGGELCVPCEYRMSKAEMLEWNDKQNGQKKSAPLLRHTVELGQTSVTVNERVPDNTKLEDIRVPLKKGESVLLVVSEWTVAKGLVSCRGKLEKLESSPSPGNQASLAGAGGRNT